MENLENNELTPAKKTKQAELTSLEAQVIARSADLNEPALCAMFELTHEQVSEILAKAPKQPCLTC